MRKTFACIALILTMHEASAVTPGYYLITTYENDDEKIVDFNFWNVKAPNSPAVDSPQIGFAYGITPQWYSELYATDIHTENGGTTFSDLSWQNDYLLTHGQYPIDVAMHTQITRYHDRDDGVGFEYGPVLQTDIDRTQINANVFFERNYQAAQSNTMQMKYQWQVKYRWRPEFAYGLQGFGELGTWDDWSPLAKQSHRIGPTIFWRPVRQGDDKGVTIEAAYLFGKIADKEAKTFILRARYEF